MNEIERRLRFTVVVPTYRRRDVVVRSVAALARQSFGEPFEVVVVVDGSEDGSAEALSELDLPVPVVVVEQPNRGLAAARNRGAEEARGELVLFLDDDMEADPSLLAEHDRSHREGADVVLGHVPLHPKSPRNFLTAAVEAWADARGRRLAEPGAELGLNELIGGQMSLRRDLFWRLGGFDTDFTRGGTFGNEDLELGLRLVREGCRIVFNVDAVSRQLYVVTPRAYLRQWRQAGRAAVLLARKHPEQIEAIVSSPRETFVDRTILRALRQPARAVALLLARIAPNTGTTSKWFFRVRDLEYFRGVRDEGGMPTRRPIRVLCYHAICDLDGAPLLAEYGIPAAQFASQLDALARRFRFIDAEEFLRFLDGAGVPKRPILLTFDDAYADLVTAALPLLEERAIPAVAFAVTQRLGGTNDWDAQPGAPRLPLASAAELRSLPRRGIAIGSHTRSHRMLNRLTAAEVADELEGSRRDLQTVEIPSTPLVAYPHGEYDDAVQRAAKQAGYAAAFTVEAGMVRDGANRYALPRLEIFRSDRGLRLWWKILKGGRGERS